MTNLAGSFGFGSDINEREGSVVNSGDAAYNQKINSITERLNRINAEVEGLKTTQNQLSHAVKENDIKNLDHQIEDKTKEIRMICDGCKKDLDVLKNENEQIKSREGVTPALRVRVNLYSMAISKMQNSLDILNTNQDNYQTNLRRLCKNRMTKVGDMEDAEAEEIIENYNPRLSDVLDMGTADYVINKLESRRGAALQLEKDLRELHEMFLEFSVLVQNQQELFDSIEHQVNSAQQNTSKGVDELEKAKKHQKKSRKCICALIIVGLVALLVIIAIILGTVLGTMNKA